LTKDDVRKRRRWKSKISVDRGWKEYGTLPPPTIWNGKYPLWAEDVLDAFEAQMTEPPDKKRLPPEHTIPALKALKRKRKRKARAQAAE
jgi:hypothetical protein